MTCKVDGICHRPVACLSTGAHALQKIQARPAGTRQQPIAGLGLAYVAQRPDD